MYLAVHNGVIARGSTVSLNILTSAMVLAWGICANSEKTGAHSTLAGELRGDWRLDGQHCSGFGKDESAVSFGVDSVLDDYVSFGKAKCTLRTTGDLSLAVANVEACRKSGFPAEFIGEYTLIVVDHHEIRGHIAFRNLQGEMQFMKDCRVHQ